MPPDTVFGRLLGSPLAIEELDPRIHVGALLPEEASIVAGAVPRRVSEFTAGRTCARQALSKLKGPSGYALLQGEDRGPIWPTGFVGSITHADFWCAAAVARESDVRAVGIDIESVA
ncbi:MAG: 4'-phosphopantetheinyl transferase, partial [Myxococcota bacterium]